MSTVEKTEKNVVEFEFSVSGEDFRAAIEKAYKQNVGKINIQGFRRGKAPRQIIERYYGSEVFFEDAVNIVLPDAYDKAIDEQNIEAVAQPEIDVKEISRENGVVFTAKVVVKPDFELGEYNQALNIFQNIDKKYQKNISVMMYIAKCYEALSQNDEALKYLDKVIEIFPENEDAHEMIRRLS